MRFYLTLWLSKMVMWFNKVRGNERDDWPGLLAWKLCPDFFSKVGKPELVLTITGTNGKTTTSALMNNLLESKGYSTSFNDWGANIFAGYALNLMRGVTVFNKPRVDASILEADELTLCDSMPFIEPQYIMVTNISKDSLRRNGHPEYIFSRIEKTFDMLGDKTTAVLNANDPISSQLAEGNRKIYYGMCDTGINPYENIAKDITLCPKCGGKIKYNYRHYRHIGDFYCEECDFKTPEMDYYAEKVDYDAREMTVVEKDGESYTYPLISDSVFNAFNVLSFIAMARELSFSKKDIADFLLTQKVTEIRETMIEFDGIKYYTHAAKGQNVSAASTVFEYLAKDPAPKDVVVLLDEFQDKNHPTETISWLYESDFEYLNAPSIKKIIVGGHMFLNHKLRMLMAGIPEDKIVCVEEEEDVVNYVDTEGIEKVYVLFEIDEMSRRRNIRDKMVERAKKLKFEKEQK